MTSSLSGSEVSVAAHYLEKNPRVVYSRNDGISCSSFWSWADEGKICRPEKGGGVHRSVPHRLSMSVSL